MKNFGIKKHMSLIFAVYVLFGATGNKAFASSEQKKVNIPKDAFVYNSHSYYVWEDISGLIYEYGSYTPIENGMTFDEMESFCEIKGGHLAVINSADEDRALYGYITSLGYSSCYFGLTDEKKEGE